MTDITTLPEIVKVCTCCKQTKTSSQFYKNRTTKTGLCSYCKDCDRASSKRYQKSKNWKDYEKSRNGSVKRRAKDKVNAAVRSNKIPRVHTLTCQCGQQAQEYHHPSYLEEDWLKVVPLCVPCHKAIHRNVSKSPDCRC